MKNLKLLLGVCLLTAGHSLMPTSASAMTLQDFAQSLTERREVRRESEPERQRASETESGHGFLDSLFGFQRWGWQWLGGRNPRDVIIPRKPEFHKYQAEALFPLAKPDLAGEVSESAYSQLVHDTLKNGSHVPIRVGKAEKKAILDFYEERKFEPLWVGTYGLNLRARRLIDALSRAHEDGLVVASYVPPSIGSFDEIDEDLLVDPQAVVDLELGLTASALMFARHASGGQVKPNRIGRSYDLKPPVVAPAEALLKVSSTLHPEDYLDSLHPTHPLYVRMKKILAKERSAVDDEPGHIPDGELIRVGSEDYRVPLIRARLRKLGFLPDNTGQDDPDGTGQDDYEVFGELGYPLTAESVLTVSATTSVDRDHLYDVGLERAVREFQDSRRLSSDGIVGQLTIAALNGRSAARLSNKLEINMERFRWLPRSLGRKHIIVNQAAYQAQMIENGRKVHQMRVIVGKPLHPTPIFSDEMETVVFNPYWNVPRSITVNEMLPRLMEDPGYLDREGFQVIDVHGKQVSSRSIDWWNYDGDTLSYDVRQPPGRNNALGEIKFLFPNKHAVYMHDTPEKHLFRDKDRAYSHGCVRVQDPRRFAEMVLKWSATEVASAVETDRNWSVDLVQKIPVHMTYFTLWPDDSGALTAHSDMYRRDAALKNALRLTKTALTR